MTATTKDIVKTRILWTLGMVLISVLFVMSVQRKAAAPVDNLVVAIKPIKGDNNLITSKDIMTKCRAYLGYDIRSAKIASLDLHEIENMLNEDQRVKLSHVFIDGRNRLNIWIVQRQPIVRIMDGASTSYYIDEDGKFMHLVANATIRVPIATGHIELYQDSLITSKKNSKLKEVYEISKHLIGDDLLWSMIEQIDVEANNEIVLIPKIGRHELTIGDSHDLTEKFDNLKVMYKEGLPRAGWRKYSVLRLNFKGQVVGKMN